jgi:hypothetical protein
MNMSTDPKVDVVHLAYLQAAAECRAIESPIAAFKEATALKDGLESLVNQSAELRAEMAYRTRQEGNLSFAQVGAALGFSKGRAEQFAKIAKEAIARRASSGESEASRGSDAHGPKSAIDSVD